MLPALLDTLRSIVGPSHVLVDRDLVAHYETDWTGRFRGSAPAVVRPANTGEVARVLSACNEARAAVVPQGGNTGLAGGSVPLTGEIVLALDRLRDLGPIETSTHQVTAGAGVTIEQLRQHARARGLQYAVDLAARGSATVGGTIATNAGGIHVLRYGGTREQLVGVEAVLADGSVVSHLGGLEKDNTGYDLAQLFCGSEGTLAVITAARLRLVPAFPHRVAVLTAFASAGDAVSAALDWRYSIDSIDALELFLRDGLTLVCQTMNLPAPFVGDWQAYVLIEASGRHDPASDLLPLLARDARVRDSAVATDTQRIGALWRYREEHTTAINLLGAPHKLDVALPPAQLAGFLADVRTVVESERPGARVWLFGHVGDGNVHVNVTGIPAGDDSIDQLVLELVAATGGSISAEHGIGTAKKRWLHLNRTPAEIDAFKRIKGALDPNGILNPNVLLP